MKAHPSLAVVTLVSSLCGLIGHTAACVDTRQAAIEEMQEFGEVERPHILPRFRPDKDEATPSEPRNRPVINTIRKVIQGGLEWWCLPGIISTCVFTLCGTAAFCSLVWLIGQAVRR